MPGLKPLCEGLCPGKCSSLQILTFSGCWEAVSWRADHILCPASPAPEQALPGASPQCPGCPIRPLNLGQLEPTFPDPRKLSGPCSFHSSPQSLGSYVVLTFSNGVQPHPQRDPPRHLSGAFSLLGNSALLHQV